MQHRIVILCLLCLCIAGARHADGEVMLVKEGKALGVIVCKPGEGSMVTEAADLAARVIQASSSAQIPVVAEAPAGNTVLRITATPPDDKLDEDGFVISSPSPTEILVAGGSAWGAMFGTQELLERYLGVRWLLPGEIGEHIPKHGDIAVPRVTVREEPAFFSRRISGYLFKGSRHKNPHTMWLMRQRRHSRVEFHHYLLHLFPADKYVKSHPHFFPTVNGEHYLPTHNNDHGWQPVLDADGIVEEAVKNINDFFNTHPDAESYSLGMNDSHAWDDSVTQGDVRRNSIGLLDQSDYYFRWASRVADGVLETHPDKWFGCLAYNEVVDPPKQVTVNPRVLPYVCIDRMTWADPEARQADIDRTRAWLEKVPRLAWYDYVYGDQHYKLPRVYPRLMGEYLRFANEAGVVAYYAEHYPTAEWREGPKLYVLFKLLWDPTRDVDAILDEWCRVAVGDDAAPHLAAYFAFWEQFWTQRVPHTAWFQIGRKRTVYLKYYKEAKRDISTRSSWVTCRRAKT